MNEPNKAVCSLTPLDSVPDEHKADLFLQAGLARIDNVFQITRRLFNAFERPLGTPSAQMSMWNGYAPYNPAMVRTYLTIFRVVNNFILVGDDGRTPAMRLGITKNRSTTKISWARATGAASEAVPSQGDASGGLKCQI